MKPPPRGWPRIASALYYDDAGAAIDWLCRAFGFTCRMRVQGEGGTVAHSELELDGGLIMVSSINGKTERPVPLSCRSPRELGGWNTQTLCVVVDDVDAHCARARELGAVIAEEPKTTDYGPDYWTDRTYRAIDPEGHQWWFLQRVREQGAPR